MAAVQAATANANRYMACVRSAFMILVAFEVGFRLGIFEAGRQRLLLGVMIHDCVSVGRTILMAATVDVAQERSVRRKSFDAGQDFVRPGLLWLWA